MLLHEKIYQDILNKINSHQYEEGALLPSEGELCAMYQASRSPVRQAMARLDNEGLIVRKAGKGTFVAGRKIWPHAQMGGMKEELAKKGPFLHCETKVVASCLADEKTEQECGIAAGTAYVQVDRIRYYDEEPIHFLRHYVIGVPEEAIKKEKNFSSLLAIYDALGIPLARTEDVIEAVGADSEIAANLHIPVGYPVLLIKRYTYKRPGTLLEMVHFYIKTNDWKYRVTYENQI